MRTMQEVTNSRAAVNHTREHRVHIRCIIKIMTVVVVGVNEVIVTTDRVPTVPEVDTVVVGTKVRTTEEDFNEIIIISIRTIITIIVNVATILVIDFATVATSRVMQRSTVLRTQMLPSA